MDKLSVIVFVLILVEFLFDEKYYLLVTWMNNVLEFLVVCRFSYCLIVIVWVFLSENYLLNLVDIEIL